MFDRQKILDESGSLACVLLIWIPSDAFDDVIELLASHVWKQGKRECFAHLGVGKRVVGLIVSKFRISIEKWQSDRVVDSGLDVVLREVRSQRVTVFELG